MIIDQLLKYMAVMSMAQIIMKKIIQHNMIIIKTGTVTIDISIIHLIRNVTGGNALLIRQASQNSIENMLEQQETRPRPVIHLVSPPVS